MKHPESNVSAGPSSGPGSRLPSWRTHFLHCPGAPVRGKLGLTEQRRSAFLEPASTSLPNKVFFISEHFRMSPEHKRCLAVALKKQRMDLHFFGLDGGKILGHSSLVCLASPMLAKVNINVANTGIFHH